MVVHRGYKKAGADGALYSRYAKRSGPKSSWSGVQYVDSNQAKSKIAGHKRTVRHVYAGANRTGYMYSEEIYTNGYGNVVSFNRFIDQSQRKK